MTTVTLYREVRQRDGANVCHLFRDCYLARAVPTTTIRTDSTIPLCQNCVRMARDVRMAREAREVPA